MQDQEHLLLNRYSLEQQLASPEPLSGRPVLFSGHDIKTGSGVLVKLWPRRNDGKDLSLQSIWQNEVRQLQRLAGYSGAREYLVTLLDAGNSSSGFWVVLNANQRLPLKWRTQQPSINRPLTLRSVTRRLVWKNLRRVAQGLGILHSHGLIHRNLDEWSVFTDGGNSPDYQLGGFEWSIRLSAAGTRMLPFAKTDGLTSSYSFRHDWQSFGELSARLLDVDRELLLTSADSDPTISRKLLSEELILLRDLIFPGPIDRSDSETVTKQIDRIIASYGTQLHQEKAGLCLVYSHDVNSSSLAKTIDDSDRMIYDITDADNLRDFLELDIADANLLELRQTESHHHRYALVGRRNTYFLKEYNGTWQFASIRVIDRRKPSASHILRRHDIPPGIVEVKTPREVSRDLIKLRAEIKPWDSLFEEVDEHSEFDEPTQHRYDAFVLLHLIEILHDVTAIWPIEIQDVSENRDGTYTYIVRYKPEDSREELSRTLGLASPYDRLRDALEDVQEDIEAEWSVAERGLLVSKSDEDEWTFIETLNPDQAQSSFRFIGTHYFSSGEKLYLRDERAGQGELIQRRTTLLLRLREHAELMDVLSDPLAQARASHDPTPAMGSDRLDPSKQRAIAEIFGVLPIYLLQGPPGVGKTHLVNELVKARFFEDPSTRMLITAQVHDAVNHLMSKICAELDTWAKDPRPLVVRTRNRRGKTVESAFHMKHQADNLLTQVVASPLFANVRPYLQQKIRKLQKRVREAAIDAPLPDRTLESLILRSANLVFSTTNSGELERMMSSSAQFDWSIVEEAGRATGTELLATLMLSHRRLLIGDPKQLPPFGEEKVKSLLREPQKLLKALECGRSFLDRAFDELGIDELIHRSGNPVYAARLVDEVANVLLLFESLHEKASRYKSALPIAGLLEQQHRMHPRIAEVVSTIFYDGRLSSSDSCNQRFQQQSPLRSLDPRRLPDEPIVIVDMPYVQNTVGMAVGEEPPAHHNPLEVEAVVNVLSLLDARESTTERPTLAVLSPYREQVKRLRRRLRSESGGRLQHLNKFQTKGDLVRTIDSFQGNEASVVVASLVRNNARSWRGALGIVADPRRMNVLLSRPEHKLILVCSLDFLKARFLPGRTLAPDDDLYFLNKWLTFIENQSKTTVDRSVAILKYDDTKK